jgi:hypothetical protein
MSLTRLSWDSQPIAPTTASLLPTSTKMVNWMVLDYFSQSNVMVAMGRGGHKATYYYYRLHKGIK